MTQTGRGIGIIGGAGVVAIGASLAMSPCSPREAILGVTLGATLGGAIAWRSLGGPPRTVRNAVVNAVVWIPIGAILILLAGSNMLERLSLPDWILSFGGFFVGAGWITLMVTMLVSGSCMIAYHRGSVGLNGRASQVRADRADHSG